MLEVCDLIWDEWNVDHIKRHGVTTDEETAVCRRLHIVRATYGGRLLITGTNDEGHLLSIVLNANDDDIYYPVTARPASRRERRWYREEMEQPNDAK